MGQESELSPQNKLKDIFHTIFKRNDLQVAGGLITAQVGHESAFEYAAPQDAVTTAGDAAAAPVGALEPCAGPQPTHNHQRRPAREQQPSGSSSSTHKDSASTLDVSGAAPPAEAPPKAGAGVRQQHGPSTQQLEDASVTAHAAACSSRSLAFEQPTASSSAAGPSGVDCAHPAAACAGLPEPAALQPNSLHLSHSGAAAGTADPRHFVGQPGAELPASAAGEHLQEQHLQEQQRGGAFTAQPVHAAIPATTMRSEPCPNGLTDGGGRRTSAGQHKVVCASVDDLYNELFGDVPLPSASSSAAASPFGGPLGSIRGLSSMSPMTTSSAFCHQHAAAAAIAGSGGMPAMRTFLAQAVSPSAHSRNSNSPCSSFEGCSGSHSPFGGCGRGGSSYGDCAATPVGAQAHPMDDMLPPGAYPPRVRVVVHPKPSRFSGSDGCSSSLFPEDSPSCCSSSAGGQAWPGGGVGAEEPPSVAVSTLSSGQNWGSRGSLRYGSPHAATQQQQQQQQQQPGAVHPPTPAVHAAAPADGSRPTPKSSLRTRWSNWINGSGAAGSGSPGRPSPGAEQLQLQHQQQGQDAVHELGGPAEPSATPWLSCSRANSPKRGVLAAQSAPGNAAVQLGAYGSSGSSRGLGPPHPLVHCHSNPELLHAGAGIGHGRAHLGCASGLGGSGGPPCARSLFGSLPQMERPLMMAGSLGGNSSSNNSSGWLSGPGGVGFGTPARSESFGVLAGLGGCDDAVSVASADEEVIWQVNADNVLSTAWGPGAHSAPGGSAAGGGSQAGHAHPHPHASHPKLLAFKYCCATSPLNHPGRASPFNSARNSPFNSPRGSRDTVFDLMPLRSAVAAAAAAAASCPGSPLRMRHSTPFSSSSHGTPAVDAAAASAALAAAAAAAADGASARSAVDTQDETVLPSGVQSHKQLERGVLRKQGSSSFAKSLLDAATAQAAAGSTEQQLDGAAPAGASDHGASCSSSSGSSSSNSSSGSSSKPPLQSRPVRGLLRTPPPPLPLPLPLARAAHDQATCRGTADTPELVSASSGRTVKQGSAGPSPADRPPVADAAARVPGNRRVSAPAGLSAFMMRFSSSSGSAGSGSAGGKGSGRRSQQSPAAAAAADSCPAGEADVPESASAGCASGPGHAHDGGLGSRVGGHSLPLPLPSCSVDVGSPKQQLQTASSAGPDSRCSPRRQSSSRLGASGGFTTPSRLSHNSTMAEALAASSSGGVAGAVGAGGGGSGSGGFALQRTSSCSSSGWPAVGSNAKSSAVCGCSSSSGCAAGALAGHDGGLLSATSVPLPVAYDRGQCGDTNCSDSSEGSWSAGQGPDVTPGQGQQRQWAADATPPQAAVGGGGGRYGSCNGASDASTADCQECPYPGWCSSSNNCWSPLVPLQQEQPQQPARAEQQQQQPAQECPGGRQEPECGRRQQPHCASMGAPAAAAQANDQGCSAGDAAAAAAGPAAAPPSLPEVDFLEKIGRGSFGDVFKGVWCGSIVAVKVIQVKQPSALTFPSRHSAGSNHHHQQQQDLRSHPLAEPPGAGASAAAATAAAAAQPDVDSQAAQVALELAQHEYESWLNANLRHPNIVQLFTSFTIGLEERAPALAAAAASLLFGCADGEGGRGLLLGDSGGGAGAAPGLSWKTHLVMEFCELGTMQDLLQRGVFSQHGLLPGGAHLCWVLATAKEFCTAVCYLHSMDVVHGDLKSSNVLLKAAAVTAWDSRGFVAKVSDFGLSRVMDAISAANGEGPLTPSAASPDPLDHNPDLSTAASAGAAGAAADAARAGAGTASGAACGPDSGGGGAGGSLGWAPCQPRFGALSHAAPELIQGQELSKASDVYSIGVLLWELLTGQTPYYGMHPGQLLSLKLSQHTSQLLPFSPSTPPGLAQLCLDCWAAQPCQRPSMATVVLRINDLAVTLLGQEQAVAMFPDVAASLAAQRRLAATAAAAGR